MARILGRSIGYSIKVPLKIKETVTVKEQVPVIVEKPPTSEFYLGPSVFYNQAPGVGVGCSFVSKNNRLYSIQIGSLNNHGFVNLHYGIKF